MKSHMYWELNWVVKESEKQVAMLQLEVSWENCWEIEKKTVIAF